jgi:alpha-galactosidase
VQPVPPVQPVAPDPFAPVPKPPKRPLLGEKTFLSELREEQVNSGAGGFFKGKRKDKPLAVKGVPAPHGLCVYPREDRKKGVVQYKLDPAVQRFKAQVGFNDERETDHPGVAHFVLVGDGRQLWESSWIWERQHIETCDIELDGISVLELQVEGYGMGPNSHPVWVEPTVLR